MLLSEYIKQAVEQVIEEGRYAIVHQAWNRQDWAIEGHPTIGLCPLSCALYVCTGEIPNLQEKVDDGLYPTVEDTIRRAVFPTLESCCTINLTVQTLAGLIKEYDSNHWPVEELIERIHKIEERATAVEV